MAHVPHSIFPQVANLGRRNALGLYLTLLLPSNIPSPTGLGDPVLSLGLVRILGFVSLHLEEGSMGSKI